MQLCPGLSLLVAVVVVVAAAAALTTRKGSAWLRFTPSPHRIASPGVA